MEEWGIARLQTRSGSGPLEGLGGCLKTSEMINVGVEALTSRLAKMQAAGKGPRSSRIWRKWVVSLTKDGNSLVGGFRKWSTNCEMRLVSPLLVEMMGLPLIGLCFLWNFGNRYSSGVLQTAAKRKSLTIWSISPFWNKSSTSLETILAKDCVGLWSRFL